MKIRKIKMTEDLPFVVGRTYMTKFATHEMFTVTGFDEKDGKQTKLFGIYEKHTNLGIVPIFPDRLIADHIVVGETEVCWHCGE